MGARLRRQVSRDIEENWNVDRGSNSPIYARAFIIFNPCGTMFPHGFLLQATWTHGGRRIETGINLNS